MKRHLCLVAVIAFGTAVASDSDQQTREHDTDSDRFVAGGAVSVNRPVAGDLLAVGGDVRIEAAVGGDAIAVGGEVRIDAPVSQDLYAAAGRMSLNSTVQRNARVAAGRLEIGPQGRVAGNLTAAGGQVHLRGDVGGYVQSAGGRVHIDASVGGDVEASGGEVQLGPNARIGGKLRYTSAGELQRDPASQVLGGIERIGDESRWAGESAKAFVRVACWFWTVGVMIVAAGLIVVLPAFFARLTDVARTRLPFSLLLGFIMLVCVPVAVVLLFATGIGIPLALLGLLAFGASLMVGYSAACIALGDSALRWMKPDRVQSTAWRAAAAVLAVLCIALLIRIPFLGVLIAVLALLVGVGALLLQLHSSVTRAAA